MTQDFAWEFGEASKAGDLEKLQELLAEHPGLVRAQLILERTPLHEEVQQGRKQAVDLLLAAGADVNAKDKYGKTPLHHAARLGRTDIVEALLHNGAKVSASDEDWSTPLHEAAMKDHTDLASLLISRGAKVDVRKRDDRTPLNLAVSCAHRDMVELLLANKADPNFNQEYHKQPLLGAIDYPEIAELLLAHGADINAIVDGDGGTLLHQAALIADLEGATFLLDHNAVVGRRDIYGRTPLHVAAAQGHMELVKLLLSRDADAAAETKPPERATPGMLAEKKGHADVANLLRQSEERQAKKLQAQINALLHEVADK